MTGAIQMIRQFITYQQLCIRPEGNVSAAYPIRIVSDIDAFSPIMGQPAFVSSMNVARR